MTRLAVVRIYKAPDGWRWSFSRNGRIRADGGQGYSRHIDCWRGMVDVLAVCDGCDESKGLHRHPIESLRLVDEGKP